MHKKFSTLDEAVAYFHKLFDGKDVGKEAGKTEKVEKKSNTEKTEKTDKRETKRKADKEETVDKKKKK